MDKKLIELQIDLKKLEEKVTFYRNTVGFAPRFVERYFLLMCARLTTFCLGQGGAMHGSRRI